ncbi:respiratory nitrate reductase chaperone NarJ [Microbulbifer donghaiensis]|uniref:Respiratory nitrate reductase chaperone NarJ n=1 Tax=Microbulbifer donghaiensis TaxID=494016 RepID=A0A1M5G9W9_9GAMM|nr:nitrate reductase molybdenum cofactor assembly chaperone [Microbulbifer donghaiensis]SHG00557.1 respiratory nitrate reductase chaperone NarJ [Microbulbifer donghaiensis]
MRKTLRALAHLLDYPSETLKAHIAEVRKAIEGEACLSAGNIAHLEPLLQKFERAPLLDLQMRYSALFDNSRALSLHFFEHIHGENAERGQAMINLGEEYIERGYLMTRDELPDFIPMFLEFISCLPVDEARDWLSQPAHVFAVLKQRLDERESEYAGLFHLLLCLADEKPDPQAIRELLARGQESENASVDDSWEEEPVTFMAAHHNKPVSSIVAKLKAAGKLIMTSRDN